MLAGRKINAPERYVPGKRCDCGAVLANDRSLSEHRARSCLVARRPTPFAYNTNRPATKELVVGGQHEVAQQGHILLLALSSLLHVCGFTKHTQTRTRTRTRKRTLTRMHKTHTNTNPNTHAKTHADTHAQNTHKHEPEHARENAR